MGPVVELLLFAILAREIMHPATFFAGGFPRLQNWRQQNLVEIEGLNDTDLIRKEWSKSLIIATTSNLDFRIRMQKTSSCRPCLVAAGCPRRCGDFGGVALTRRFLDNYNRSYTIFSAIACRRWTSWPWHKYSRSLIWNVNISEMARATAKMGAMTFVD